MAQQQQQLDTLKEQVLQEIQDYIEEDDELDTSDEYGDDMHSSLFNSYSGILVGNDHAAKNVFDNDLDLFLTLLGEVVEYQEETFGEVTADVASPKEVLNCWYYQQGAETMAELSEAWEKEKNEQQMQR
jgi:hypothetical protein